MFWQWLLTTESWVAHKVGHDVLQLSKFASSQPHATYSAIIHGLSFNWTLLSRIFHFLAPCTWSSLPFTVAAQALSSSLKKFLVGNAGFSKILNNLVLVSPLKTTTTFQFLSLQASETYVLTAFTPCLLPCLLIFSCPSSLLVRRVLPIGYPPCPWNVVALPFTTDIYVCTYLWCYCPPIKVRIFF